MQIPLISYARLLGYPVDERETATPEEAEKEKRRIKNLMKDVRGKINDQLDVLYSLSLSWSEKKGASRIIRTCACSSARASSAG